MNLLSNSVSEHEVKKTSESKRLLVDNKSQVLPVYDIRIDKLFFNDKNDRIATWISQYKTTNNVDDFDFSDIEQYNSVIHKFIEESNPDALLKTQKNIASVGQLEPGVVLPDGRIIDGNRRFTCLRNIQEETGKTQYFRAAILDRDITKDAKQIKMLELLLQHGVESRVDYNPIDKLVGIYRDIVEDGLLTVREYAASTNTKEADVDKSIEIAKLMVEYLDFINAPKQYHIAREQDLNGPLVEAYAILKKEKDKDRNEDLKNIIFTNLLYAPAGDMTRYIRKIKKLQDQPKLMDEYVRSQEEVVEQTCDDIENLKEVNATTIEVNMRSDEDAKRKLSRGLERAVAKADNVKTRNRPADLIDKACDALAEVDQRIFVKLTDEEMEKVIQNLDRLQTILDEIKETLDV